MYEQSTTTDFTLLANLIVNNNIMRSLYKHDVSHFFLEITQTALLMRGCVQNYVHTYLLICRCVVC